MPPVLEEVQETLEQYALPSPRRGAGSEWDCCRLVFPKLQELARQMKPQSRQVSQVGPESRTPGSLPPVALHTVTLPSQLVSVPFRKVSPQVSSLLSPVLKAREQAHPHPDIVLQHLLPSLCSHTGRQMGDIASGLGTVRSCGCLLQGQRPTEAPEGEKRLCMHISEHGCAVACWVHVRERYGLHVCVSHICEPPKATSWFVCGADQVLCTQEQCLLALPLSIHMLIGTHRPLGVLSTSPH